MTEKINPEDISNKFRQLQDEVEGQASGAKNQIQLAAIGGVVLMILLSFILGQRKGKKKTTVVEIRRV